MNKNLEQFKHSFEEFQNAFNAFQLNLKNDSSNIISYLVKEGRFDETQIAVECLKELFSQIQIDYNFNAIEDALGVYNSKIQAITTVKEANETFTPEQIENFQETIRSKQVDSEPHFEQNDFESKPGDSKEAIEDITKILSSKGYILGKVNGSNFNIKKRNKNIQMVYIQKEEFNDEQFISLLDEMNELKSIGFIFADVLTMKKSKVLLNEWAKTKPKHETRFLSVNLSNLEKIEEESPFEVVTY